MADSVETVTHGFCLNDSILAYGMLHSQRDPKIIENRQVAFKPGWYAVSLTGTAHTSIRDETEYRKKEPGYKGPLGWATSNVLGLAKVGYALPYDECKHNHWASSSYKVCNIITEVLPFPRDDVGPKVRNNFGTFPLDEKARVALSKHAKAHKLVHGTRKTNAENSLPACPGALEQARAEAKEAKGKGKEKAPVIKPNPTISKGKQPAGKAPKSKKAPLTDAEKDHRASMREMNWCAKHMPETHGHEVIKKGILDYFESIEAKKA